MNKKLKNFYSIGFVKNWPLQVGQQSGSRQSLTLPVESNLIQSFRNPIWHMYQKILEFSP